MKRMSPLSRHSQKFSDWQPGRSGRRSRVGRWRRFECSERRREGIYVFVKPKVMFERRQSQGPPIGQCQNANEVLNVLVLSRKSGERIVIGPNIELRVVDIGKTRVRLAIDAPQEIAIYRQEVYRRIQDEGGSEVRRDEHPVT